MCEPTTLLYISMAATAVGGGVSAYGAIQQGKAAKGAANYNAQVAANNQKLAEWKAQDAIARGELEQGKYARKIALIKGQQRATMAANGVDVGTGTALDVLNDTNRTGRSDLATLRENAAREAWDFRITGMNYEAESALQRSQGRNARRAGALQAGATLLGTTGTVAGQWYQHRKPQSR